MERFIRIEKSGYEVYCFIMAIPDFPHCQAKLEMNATKLINFFYEDYKQY